MISLPATPSPHRTQRSARRTWTRPGPVRVVIDWSAVGSGEAASSVARVELEANAGSASHSDTGVETKWICRQQSGSSWEKAVAAAGCAEIVLTAELDDEPAAKHLVFCLAEQVTQLLSATQPVVRIRFSPRSKRRAQPTRPSTRQ